MKEFKCEKYSDKYFSIYVNEDADVFVKDNLTGIKRKIGYGTEKARFMLNGQYIYVIQLMNDAFNIKPASARRIDNSKKPSLDNLHAKSLKGNKIILRDKYIGIAMRKAFRREIIDLDDMQLEIISRMQNKESLDDFPFEKASWRIKEKFLVTGFYDLDKREFASKEREDAFRQEIASARYLIRKHFRRLAKENKVPDLPEYLK